MDSGFAAGVTTVTLAAVPGTPGAVSVGLNSLSASWSANANPADTLYTAELSTASDFTGTMLTSATLLAQAAFVSLTSDTTYYARVKAKGRGGVETAYSPSVAIVTAPVAPGTPTLTGFAFSSGTIRWLWTAGSGGAAAAWILHASTGGAVVSLSGSATHYLETRLSTGTAHARYLEARNATASAFSSTMTVATSGNVPVGAGVSSGTVIDPVIGRPALEIPAGASTQTLVFVMSANPAAKPLLPRTPGLLNAANAKLSAGLRGSPASVREYLATAGEDRFTGTFATPVTMAIPYADADGNGLVDGTSPPVTASTLKVYWLNETAEAWEEVQGSTVDGVNKEVRVLVSHLSIYTALGATSALNLATVKVYPNPWRKGSGGSYDAVSLVFNNLTQEATIKIYTLTGDRVRILQKSAADGQGKLWDGRNDSGHPVASGTYFYLIENSAGERVSGRFSVIK